jgi:hypothetical protein
LGHLTCPVTQLSYCDPSGTFRKSGGGLARNA